MYTSLTEAAEATGMSRTTIQRAIKAGKISAPKTSDGKYAIDPSELHRVYVKRTETQNSRSNETERNSDETLRRGSENSVLGAEVEGLRAQVDLLKSERDDLRERLDKEGEERRKLTAMLTDQRSLQPKGFFAWLMGR